MTRTAYHDKLDALVAERLMGFKAVTQDEREPPYSSDIREAWRVVEKFMTPGSGFRGEQFFAWQKFTASYEWRFSGSEEFALDICEAALTALGVPLPERGE